MTSAFTPPAAAPSRRTRPWCAPLMALCLPALAHGEAFSIEAVTGAPYPSDLTSAPTGDHVAWVFDAKGVRNLWTAGAGPDGVAHAVTSFTDDDGSDIGDIAWSADATRLAFTRGATLEGHAPANPDSAPAGARPQAVWTTSADGSELRTLGPGHGASYSPDGTWLAYVDGARIMAVHVGVNEAPQPLVSDRGDIDALTWSPDGKRLAFVSQRGDHALVGVYDLARRAITWLAPSLDDDASPVFSPDGVRVAFIRTPAETLRPFITRRSGPPWSIWVADATSGAGRRVWVADPGAGSVFAGALQDQNLLWAAGDQLIFPWEKTGWRQLYSVAAEGGPARALTTGAFEVNTLALTADRGGVVYASNQDDIDRAHVWSVRLSDRRPTPVAQDRSIVTAPAVGANGALFGLQSDATTPLQPVALRGSRWRPLAPNSIPADFPKAQLVTPQAVTFTASDGQLVHGQIFAPRDGAPARRGAVLFFHGGPERQMLLGFHPMGAYNRMYAENQHLAALGYVVLSVNYRGGIGYGLDYREAKAFGPGGGSELNDLLGAVAYIKARTDVDPRRIGVYGASYGGLMTALGLARASGDIAAGVDYAGVYDWSTMLTAIGTPPVNEAAARLAIASSPIATIDRWTSPVLIVQADDDRNVPSTQASQLIADLRGHGVAHDELMLPNEVHDMSRYASWMTLFHATDDFFNHHLAPR